MLIQLTRGHSAIIDSRDWKRVKAYRWCYAPTGYAVTRTGGKYLYMHRLIADAPQGMEVDHANGNKLDNRRSNLHVVTHAQNLRNRRASINSRTGIVGVFPYRDSKRFVAQISRNGKTKYLGIFCSTSEASAAYRSAKRNLNH